MRDFAMRMDNLGISDWYNIYVEYGEKVLCILELYAVSLNIFCIVITGVVNNYKLAIILSITSNIELKWQKQ